MQQEHGDFQFTLYDDETDEALARGFTLPVAWDGTVDDLPAGIDGAVERSFSGAPANTLCAMAAEVPLRNRNRALSGRVIEAMAALARRERFAALIAPVRPSWKERYPITPIERYVSWTRDDGLPFDPWLRVHARLGGEVLKPEPRSLRVTAPVEEWEAWTGISFPEDGEYVFPQCLAPLTVRDGDGEYWEPNVWVLHRV